MMFHRFTKYTTPSTPELKSHEANWKKYFKNIMTNLARTHLQNVLIQHKVPFLKVI